MSARRRGAPTNVVWHDEDVLEIHPFDAESRGIRDGDLVALASRSGEISLRAAVTERMQPGVVYTTFHHADTGANVVTTDYSDWATNCPEYKVTAVQVRRTNHLSDWQERHRRGGARPDPHRAAFRGRGMTQDRMVTMANQIATFFRSYPHEEAVEGVATHIRQFWDPPHAAHAAGACRGRRRGAGDAGARSRGSPEAGGLIRFSPSRARPPTRRRCVPARSP